jgi:sporulation protein YlmC with PRC-barrel domain
MSRYHKHFPDPPAILGTLIDARLSLLDRQLVDLEGEPVGIIDDLELDDAGGASTAPHVTAILTGQVLFTRIFGGTPPRSRLQVLPWSLVRKIGTVVQLGSDAETFDHLWVQDWLRDNLIGRIPGGRHAAQ